MIRALPVIVISFCPTLPLLRASRPVHHRHFEPIGRAPGTVGGVFPLRHDAFQAKLASEDEQAVWTVSWFLFQCRDEAFRPVRTPES